MSETQKPVQVKLVLLGEAAVGKSSVVLRFVQNDFQEYKEPTIGAAFLTQKCRLEDKVIKFEIWDTAGQERFRSLAPMYYRNALSAVVVYDITSSSSFEKAKSWVKELQRQASPNVIIALVGNKLDLVDGSQEEDEEGDDATATPNVAQEQSRAISRDEAQAYAEESNLLFFETSAKTGEGVVEVFTEIAKKIPLEQIVNSTKSRAQDQSQQNNVNLNSNQNQSKEVGDNCAC